MRARALLTIGLLASGFSMAGSTATLAAGEQPGSDQDLFATQPQGESQNPAILTPSAQLPATQSPAVQSSGSAVPQRAAADRASAGNPLWAIPLGQLSVTRERPLFSPSRRPPPVVVAAKPPPPPPPKPPEAEKPQLSLVGTVTGEAAAGGIGVFVDMADKTAIRLKAGDNHKGWILRAVRPRQAELARGTDKIVLDLAMPDGKKAEAAPVPASPHPAPVAAVQPPQEGMIKPIGLIPAAAPAGATVGQQPLFKPGKSPFAKLNPFSKRMP